MKQTKKQSGGMTMDWPKDEIDYSDPVWVKTGKKKQPAPDEKPKPQPDSPQK